MDTDGDIASLDPVLKTGRILDPGSRLEKPGFVKRHVDVPSAAIGAHLEITPPFVGWRVAKFDRLDDRLQHLPRLAKGGA